MTKQPIGLYVHIPYCIKKCPYCDFNSYSVGAKLERSSEADYVRALVAELRHFAALPEWEGREITTIFFGGGTPSLFDPKSIAEILAAARDSFSFSPEIEITLEANPGTIQEKLGEEKLAGFRAVGVNRISMGVQSFRSEKLLALGRIHSGEDAESAAKNIAAAGFTNFNLDLIFGVEGDTPESWTAELERALALGPKHVSAYGLTIEPGTEFGRLYKAGKLFLPEDELQAQLYELSQELCAAHGYEQYEISNYAQPGFECRHNLGYWSGLDYLGLGAGAHSFLGRGKDRSEFGRRWSNLPGPKHYIEAATTRGSAEQRTETLDKEKGKLEFFFLRLRTREGVNLEEFERTFNSPVAPSLARTFQRFADQNLVVAHGERIKLSKKGFLFADGVLGEIADSL